MCVCVCVTHKEQVLNTVILRECGYHNCCYLRWPPVERGVNSCVKKQAKKKTNKKTELHNNLICILNVHVHYERGQRYQEMIITFIPVT